MEGSNLKEEKSLKEKVTLLLAEYFESTERKENLLNETLDCFEAYLKENGILIPSIPGEEIESGRLDTILWQFSLIADKLFNLKDFKLCCQLLETAIEILDQSSTMKEAAFPPKSTLLLKLSSSYLQIDKCQACIKAAQTCLKEAIERGDRLLEMQSCIILANACQRECNFVEAIYYNSKMLGIGRQLVGPEKDDVDWGNQLECKILWNISACFNSIDDPENALLYAKEYLGTVRSGSQENLTNMYSYTGKLMRLIGNFSEALHMHELELAICKRYKDRKGMGNAYGSIGLVYASMGNDLMANEFLNQQFLIAKSLEDSELLLNATKDQAEAYMKLGKISPAIESFKTLLKLARENHLWNVQGSAYRNIGKLYQIQGTLNFARHFLDEAMHRAKECSMKEEEIDAEMHLAQVLHVLGYYEEARKHFKEVVIFFEKSIDKLHHYEIQPSAAIAKKLKDCCRDLQDVLVKLKCYKEALEIAELNRSRVFFNVLKRQNAKSITNVDDTMPLNYPCIEAVLKYLSPNSVVLYYALSADGFHLWMITPKRGVVKFVTHNSLASCPLEALVRECVRSLAITNKGNRCCYDTENRRRILNQVKKSKMVKETGKIVVRHDNIIEAGEKNRDKGSPKDSSNGNMVDSDIDCSCAVSHASGSFTDNNLCPQAIDDSNAPVNQTMLRDQTNTLISPSKPHSPVKGQEHLTYDSGYDSCKSQTMQPKEETTYSEHSETDHPFQPAFDNAAETQKQQNTSDYNASLYLEDPELGALCDKLLKDLFKQLFGQIEHILSDLKQNTNLICIPDGILNIVPFNLLLDKNEEPLHNKFFVSVLPCLAIISKWKNNLDKEITNSIAIGNSSLTNAMFKNINGDIVSQESEECEEELNLVSKILGIRAISGSEATKDAFLDVLPSADIVHITSLGSIIDGMLLLTPNTHREQEIAESASYVVDLEDLSYLELKAKLVILSGCSQCPHGLSEQDEVNLHLVTGLIGAGAASVVVFMYSVPHKVQLYVIHRLFRLLETGNSVSQALKIIYNEMSASEDMSHPGYWGGVILVGRDTYVDIQTVRRKALENAIDSSTSLVRSSACIGDGKIDIDEFNPAIKANVLQSVLGDVLSEKNTEMALDSLLDLITLSTRQILDFASQEDLKLLPAVKISNDLITLASVKELLRALGYKLEPSLNEKDVTYLMLPPWNFDDILGRSLDLLQRLKATRSLSENATFSLSRCLAELDVDALNTVGEMLGTLHASPEKHVFTTDLGSCRLWVSPRIKRFLQDIGFNEVNTTLFLRNGKPYDQLQVVTSEWISILLSMYEDGEVFMSQLTARKLKKPVPWMTKRPTRNENRAKNLLAKRIVATRSDFKTLGKTGRQWHNATLQSWAYDDSQTIEIGKESKEKERGERNYHGVLKIKVKQGGTPSSCRFPIIEKRNVTKYDRYRQRENLELAFLENKKNLSRRKELEIYKSFALSDV